MDIELRPFRLAPSACPHCHKLHHQGAGCFALGVVSALGSGLIGYGISTALAPFVNLPDFRVQFTFLALIDGVAIAAVWYWRSTRRANQFGFAGVSILFLLIGMKVNQGIGFPRLITWGIGNAVFGLVATWMLLSRTKRSHETIDPPQVTISHD